jgi:hypothetical protein
LLACYGICFGLMNDKVPFVSQWLALGRGDRVIDRMLECSWCTGFHVGWVLALCGGDVSLGAFVSGFASAAFCYTLDVLLRWLEFNSVGTVGTTEAP